MITGWGKLSDESTTKADRLHFAKNLVTLSNEVCHSYYGVVTDGQVCIDTQFGEGVCNVSLTIFVAF